MNEDKYRQDLLDALSAVTRNLNDIRKALASIDQTLKLQK